MIFSTKYVVGRMVLIRRHSLERPKNVQSVAIFPVSERHA